jgi:hypothetical protein
MRERCSSMMVSCFLLFSSVLATAASAQTPDWTVDVSTGGTATVGAAHERLKGGWNVDVGGEYHVNDAFGIRGDFAYNGLGVTDQALQALQMPGGDAHLLSLTVGPVWHFPIAKNVGGYLLAGVGWYQRTVNFTQPTVGVVDIIDPWWGYLGSALVPANQILGSVTDNAIGANGGGGVSFMLGDSGASLYVEVRYDWAHTLGTSTTVTPVAFGIRFGSQPASRP